MRAPQSSWETWGRKATAFLGDSGPAKGLDRTVGLKQKNSSGGCPADAWLPEGYAGSRPSSGCHLQGFLLQRRHSRRSRLLTLKTSRGTPQGQGSAPSPLGTPLGTRDSGNCGFLLISGQLNPRIGLTKGSCSAGLALLHPWHSSKMRSAARNKMFIFLFLIILA